MRALTIWQPWAWCIVGPHDDDGMERIRRDPKRIENRTWSPPRKYIGQRIAIHAGRKIDQTALGMLWDWGFSVKMTHMPQSAILGTAILRGTIHENRYMDPWWNGPVGWQLESVRRLVTPIPCSGQQGLWLPDNATIEAIKNAEFVECDR